MFQPVGSEPPATYWRRRLVILAIPVVLILLSAFVLFGGHDKSDGQAKNSRSSHSSHPPSSSTPQKPTGKTAGAQCDLAHLAVLAKTSASKLKVGQRANLYLVVTNTSKTPCVRDLADSQIELTIYTGDVRVWGSHDCAMQPGTMLQTLAPGKPVQLVVNWLAKTSRPGCGGTRLQVQAGTYRLFAALSGKKSAPATFTVVA